MAAGVCLWASHEALAWRVWDAWHDGSLASALAPGDATLAFAIGDYYFNGGAYDLSKAEVAYRRATADDPSLFNGHYQLGRVLFVEGKLPEAVHELNLELQYHPTNLRVLYMRGLAYGYQGQYQEAENDFRVFVAWAPTEWAGYNDYAWVLAEDGKYQTAQALLGTAFEKAVNADTNPWLYNSLGVAQLNLREYAAAQQSFSKAQTLAAAMSEGEWAAAYPGDAPQSDPQGLSVFRASIAQNLLEVELHVDK